MTRKQASFSWVPPWFVAEEMVIRLSENLSIPVGTMECDLIIIDMALRFRKAFKLSAPNKTMLFYF